jgi:hypothetical protein
LQQVPDDCGLRGASSPASSMVCGVGRVDYLMLCPNCNHTASLHYPDGCHGGNFQCECTRGRDEIFRAIAERDATPWKTPATSARKADPRHN